MAARSDRQPELPLLAALSQVLIAYVIDFDNQFERRMPHRPTNHGASAGGDRGPWLVSMAMWEHCMRHIPPEGISATEFALRAGLDAKTVEMVLKRMSTWWGYLTVGDASDAFDASAAGCDSPAAASAGPAGRRGRRPAKLVCPTRHGLQAQRLWAELQAEIETRWWELFGRAAIEGLRHTLIEVDDRLPPGLPDFPPFGDQARAWRQDASLGIGAAADSRIERTTGAGAAPAWTAASQRGGGDVGRRLDLSALLSRLLVAFSGDVDPRLDMALPLAANVLRVVDEEGIPVGQLGERTGLGALGIDNSVSLLARGGSITVGTASGNRSKRSFVTPKGVAAQRRYEQVLAAAESEWAIRLGDQRLAELRRRLGELTGNGVLERAPLLSAIRPAAENWRARVPEPHTLPHYPMFSHRGGFPDGS